MRKSERSTYSDYIRDNYPRGTVGSPRKLIYGAGVNDTDYSTQPLKGKKCITCPAYKTWKHMLERVYSNKFRQKQQTYEDTTVCDSWLYFSNFRNWYIKNHVDNYHLDKDLLTQSKTYSPSTCIFVPQWLNNFITLRNNCRGEFLLGVSRKKDQNKYQAYCNNPKTLKLEHLGYFTEEYVAHEAWLARKLQIAYELKIEMDEIDTRIYPNVVDIIKKTK